MNLFLMSTYIDGTTAEQDDADPRIPPEFPWIWTPGDRCIAIGPEF
jgi:hypothetical protein